MCGIFGLITKTGTNYNTNCLQSVLERLAVLSESRGKDSAGLAIRIADDNNIQIIKGDVPVSSLIKNNIYKTEIQKSLTSAENNQGFCAFGHARLVTNGSQLNDVNNQPVVKNDIIIIHNGIIVNVDRLWAVHTEIKREYNIDTEIIPALIRKELNNTDDLITACQKSFNKLVGTYSTAIMFADLAQFVLTTNNGSLFYVTNHKDFIVFASEAYFLEKLKAEKCFSVFGGNFSVEQIISNTGCVINLTDFKINNYSIITKNHEIAKLVIPKYKIKNHRVENTSNKQEVVIDPGIYINRAKEQHLFNMLEYNLEAIRKLKRCTKCLLPETFPFIEYDAEGVCNYCHNHKSSKAANTLDELHKLVEPYRRTNGRPDCIVPFSGGRDSTYSLHIIKKDLGLNPIAFTYDWGMVTDLARRNIARVCGKLGVENIIVSADIHWKRNNIRKNVEAWLKNPALGMIPLFMAGDKFFFYYCNQVKKQTGIDLNIWGINDLENTNFKTGFAGIRPKFDKKTIYALSLKNQIQLFSFVASNILKSPKYLNSSIWDSLGSFAARYVSPKNDYYHLFDYYQWDENEVNELVKNEYDWELAIDTPTTWRIGDGTASFYNYIYYTLAGFSENDTFRSNQIREGMIDRETALKLTEEENRPRYETLRWYLEIIKVDYEHAIKIINSIPKLYQI